jgi:hypothetical protein
MARSLKSGAALTGAEKLRARAAGMEASLKGGVNYNREQPEALRGAQEAVPGELEGERGSAIQQPDSPG